MRWLPLLAVLACSPKATPPQETPVTSAVPAPTIPESQRVDHVDSYFGVEVADPYTWLEDLDAPDTVAWVTAQNEASRPYLDALPHRAAFADRLAALWDFERWGTPTRKGDALFYTYNDGQMDQPVLMVQPDGGEARVLLDPNTLSEDGTVSVASWVPSDDGAWLAYGLADAGSDWRTWKIRDVATGEDLDDTLKWVKFSGASWLPDGSGLFYSRFPEPESDAFEEKLAFQKVYFHRRGTPQADDILVHEDAQHPDWGFGAFVSDGEDRLVVHVSKGTEDKARQYVYPLASLDLTTAGGTAGGTLVKVLDAFDADYWWIGDQGDTAWFLTDNAAPKRRLIAVDLNDPRPEAWTEVVPEGEHTIASVAFVGGHFVVTRLEGAIETIAVHALDGTKLHDVELPSVGSVGGVSGTPEQATAFFSFTGFTQPSEVQQLDVASGTIAPWKSPKTPFDPDDFATESVTYTSKDGTEVPMLIVHRKDVAPDATHPTLLYGYGGFNISITPGFKAMNLAWIEAGGVYAVANLRGGGEFGKEWHDAGTKLRKQNVFDDFIAAGEWLVANGWTTPEQLGIHGRSNGGLLVGATLLQRPDLFGAAIPSVGVMDMLKYHLWTIGWAWASDYGRSDDDIDMFRALYAYSPVHNAKDGVAYPATLVTTADHDDRVVPAHSFKFTAALQHAQGGDAPVLARIETRAGHGAGTPVSMLVAEDADKLAFLAYHLGMPVAE